jgi:hypothetical protein
MAQHGSQLWSDLLHRSGAALELTKSKYHTISYLFTFSCMHSGAPVLQGGQVGPNLCVTSGDDSPTMNFQHVTKNHQGTNELRQSAFLPTAIGALNN